MQNTQLIEEEVSHEKIFEEYYSWLLRWALTLTEGKHSEAEDLVHDLFVQFIRLRPVLHPDSDHIRGYLYTMLRNMHLSRLRRAQRSPICELSIVDYDSLEQGLRSTPDRSLTEVWAELMRICDYACERKKSSRSASVLILRFFLAYFPSEIARILKTSRTPVDKYLHIARKEARLRVYRPTALQIFGQQKTSQEVLPAPDGSQECFLALRNRIFRSCEGRCFSKEDLQRIYSFDSSRSLSTSELAHLVSCPRCLDTLNSILGIRPLAERCPSRSLGREDGSPPGGGGAGSGGGNASAGSLREAQRRLDDENEHRPDYLQVAINGEINASQKITSELSELHVKVDRSRTFEFLEIFSEQNIRLLYLPIDSSNCEEEASVQLSDGRTLQISVSFSGDSPTVHVRYRDPLFVEFAAMADPALFALFQSDGNRDHIQTGSKTLRRLFAKLWIRDTDALPARAMAAIICTLLVIVATLIVRYHPDLPQSPVDLLRRASQHAVAGLKPDDLVRRTIEIKQFGASNQPEYESSVKEWVSGDAKNRMRRLYDRTGAVVAEEITRDDHTTFYSPSKQSQISALNPAHLQVQDVWQITPSAQQFQKLIAPDQPSTVREADDRYLIAYQPASKIDSGLVEATLVLRKGDLHPVEEDLVLRSGNDVRHVRLIEADYERMAPSGVHEDVFAPDRSLFEVDSQDPHREQHLSRAISIETNPESVIHAQLLLSRIGADMNGETSIQPVAHDTVQITGTVATSERRSEILSALGPMIAEGNADVHLLVADQLHPRGQGMQNRQSVEVIEPTNSEIPVDRQLRQFLTAQGTPPDQMEAAIQRYSRQVLAHADEAQQHAWALNRIVKRFTPAELSSLSPEARLEWIQIIDLHSSSLLRCAQEIRAELASFAPSTRTADPPVDAITGIDGLINAADQLLSLTRSNNRTLGSVFALSAAPDGGNALNTPDFWRSLARLEALARETAVTERTLKAAADQTHH